MLIIQGERFDAYDKTESGFISIPYTLERIFFLSDSFCSSERSYKLTLPTIFLISAIMNVPEPQHGSIAFQFLFCWSFIPSDTT